MVHWQHLLRFLFALLENLPGRIGILLTRLLGVTLCFVISWSFGVAIGLTCPFLLALLLVNGVPDYVIYDTNLLLV